MKKRVLVVDDEEIIHQVVHRALGDDSMDFVDAYNGLEAMAALKKNNIDLVLLDVVMSQMDGNDVMREINKDPDTRKIPVIMLTGKGEVVDQIVGYELGVKDYITKPFDVKDLKRRVIDFLR